MKTFGYYLAGLAVVFGLVLAGCAPKGAPIPTPSPPSQAAPAPAPQLSAWDNVLAAARKEGTVTIYNGLGAPLGEAFKAGMKAYGINVEAITGQGTDIELRIATEQRAKAYAADLIVSGSTNPINIMQAGYGQPVNVALPSLQEKDVWRVDPSKYVPTYGVYAFSMAISPSIIINTELVKKGEIQSWQDLLDPKYKEKMVMYDPRQGTGAGASGMGDWSTVLGEDFWKKMVAQGIVLQINSALPINQVAYGEKYLAIFPHGTLLVAAIVAGAPIQIVHLKEGTRYTLYAVARVKSSPHPNSALVALNWMFSKEGQAAMGAATQNWTVRNDVTEKWLTIAELRPGFKLLEVSDPMDTSRPQKGAEFTKKIFGVR